ncbi:MAG: hypothetical protein V7K14_22010, partial [Nostoc sp.]
ISATSFAISATSFAISATSFAISATSFAISATSFAISAMPTPAYAYAVTDCVYPETTDKSKWISKNTDLLLILVVN